jgi:regulator of sigma E protease
MFDLPGVFGTLANLAVIVLGFGAIIFIHELGHFLAAKWAGIRVLAFSIGMGPVASSYRKGLGFRKGSSEPEYLRRAGSDAGADGISPTEYRLSTLPLGGYVKMLGQEDANPGAVSDAPDSYQNCKVWKRMVVISAGVIMNLITAAILFVIVFMVGLKVQPPIIGRVAENSPAAMAEPIGRDDVAPGLMPEDTVLEVDGRRMRALNEVTTEVAMSGLHKPVRVLVQRPGVAEPIEFEAKPTADEASGLLDLGIGPAVSPVLAEWTDKPLRDRYAQIVGLGGLRPGDRLERAAGEPADRPYALVEAANASGGEPFDAVFATADGQRRTVTIRPERQLQRGEAMIDGERATIEHLLGLRPLLRVDPAADPEATKQGLRPGDVIVRIGDTDAPAIDEAMGLIKAKAGRALQIEVLRGTERVTLDVTVTRDGKIGFVPDSTASGVAVVATPVRVAAMRADASDAEPPPLVRTPASELIDRPGTRVVSVGGTPVDSLRDVAGALVTATDAAFAAGESSFVVPVTLELPLPSQTGGASPVETRDWTLSRSDIESVRALGWTLPGDTLVLALFELEQTIDKAASPIAAVGRGIAKSRQVMNQTYLTFLRLFQGTVKVQHLKGPVGIAHLGTQVAEQGFVWVLFFLALVSVNLAVINFLPLPIVDGGQFLMLAYEGLRRKPVPIVFQNVATLAGLALIGAVFLIVTFHDIKALFGA